MRMFRERLYRFGNRLRDGELAWRHDLPALRSRTRRRFGHLFFTPYEVLRRRAVQGQLCRRRHFCDPRYLIAGTIFDELETSSFSLARRILPALLLVVAASVAVGLLVMTTEPFVEFSRSIFPGHLFYSEHLLPHGYFAEPRVLTPLLHTCSLSVEEQFYLLFPLLRMLVWARSALTPFLAVGMVASLWLAIYTRHSDPSETHARHFSGNQTHRGEP